MSERAYIGLGSNLGDRLAYLRAGIEALQATAHIELEAVSSAYESPPQGYVRQPHFLNAACCLRTTLPPETLLEHLRRIEDAHQRQRRIRWGPRTLDLDLLLYGERQLHTDALTLPHPHLGARDFVLVPLCQIAPHLRHPQSQRPLADYLRALQAPPLPAVADLRLPPQARSGDEATAGAAQWAGRGRRPRRSSADRREA